MEYYKLQIVNLEKDQIVQCLTEYLKSTYFPIKVGNEHYFYDTGLYKTESENKIDKFAIMDLKKIIACHPNLNIKLGDLAEDAWNEMVRYANQKK
jgi:hypothetical protein